MDVPAMRKRRRELVVKEAAVDSAVLERGMGRSRFGTAVSGSTAQTQTAHRQVTRGLRSIAVALMEVGARPA